MPYRFIFLASRISVRFIFCLGLIFLGPSLKAFQAAPSLDDLKTQLERHLAQNNVEGQMITLHSIARHYLNAGNFGQSRTCLDQLLAMSEGLSNLESQALALKGYADLEEKRGRSRSSLDYLKRYQVLNDSIYNRNKSVVIEELKSKYDLSTKDNELLSLNQANELLEKENRLRALSTTQWAVALVVLIVISGVLFRIQYKKAEANRELIRVSNEKTTAQIEKQRLEQERLSKELEHKNKKLTSYALNFIQKAELVKELEVELEELINEADPQRQQEIRSFLSNTESAYDLEKEWREFENYFDAVYPSFRPSLKEQFDLTDTELRLGAILKLNLNIKESTAILGKTVDGIKTGRYRLRKKLGLDAETDLVSFLMQVS